MKMWESQKGRDRVFQYASFWAVCVFEAWGLIMIGWPLEWRIIFPRETSLYSPSHPPALPSMMNRNCLVSVQLIFQHWYFLTAKFHGNPLTLAPYEMTFLIQFSPKYVCSFPTNPYCLCKSLHARVRTEDSIYTCKFVQAGSCVVACHVLAAISFRCLVSQDSCFAVCSACQT